MTPVAHLSPLKAVAGVVFLGGGSIYILSRPLWEPGGLPALVTGQDDGRLWWPLAALCALFLLPMMTVFAVKVARQRGPAVFIDEAGLHCMGWKSPVRTNEIASLSITRFRFPTWSPATVTVELESGERRQIHTIYFRERLDEVASRSAQATGLPDLEA